MQARMWLLVFGAVAAAASRGAAQPATVQAQSLFDEGRRLMKAGKTVEACTAFEASQKLDPAVTTLLNLADCREQNHQLATAWGLFVDANRMARDAGNDKLAKVATSHARKLEPRLSRLTIAVPADRSFAGLEVLRGKDPVDPASWNHALPVDGGSYTITARGPGREPWSTTRTIRPEGDGQTIEVPRLAVVKPAAPPVVAAPSTPPPVAPAVRPPSPAVTTTTTTPAPKEPAPTVASAPTPPPPGRGDAPPGEATSAAPAADPPETSRSYTLPIAFGAGGLALGGTALAFHLWGNRLYDQAQAANNRGARPMAESLRSSANTRRYLAQGFLAGALACTGVAVYLYVRGRSENRSPATAVAPIVSPDLAGLAVVGRW